MNLISVFKGIYRKNKILKKIFIESKNNYKNLNHNNKIYEDQFCTIKLKIWPYNCLSAFCLEFDDLSAKSKIWGDLEYGGDVTSELNKRFFILLDKFPFLKVTQFAVPNPWFYEIGNSNNYYKDKFLISNKKYQLFVEKILNKFISSNQVEVADHGYRHYQPNSSSKRKWIEFESCNKKEIVRLINKAKDEFKKIGLNVVGTRPPGWGLGINNAFVDAAKELEFSYISASNFTAGLNKKVYKTSNIYPSYFDGILNIPCNIGIDWSIPYLKKVISRILKYEGFISLHGHYVDSYTISNGLTEENHKNVMNIIDHLQGSYGNRIWFANYKNIAQYWIAKNDLKINLYYNDNKLYANITNNSKYDLNGLTVEINKSRKYLNTPENKIKLITTNIESKKNKIIKIDIK